MKVQAKDLTTNEVVLEGRVRCGLYDLLLTINRVGAALSCISASHYLWHCHLGHLDSAYMKFFMNNGLIKFSSSSNKLCKSCMAGKSHASPHPPRTTSYAPLALVFAEIWGPSPMVSYQGYNFYVNFVDASTNFNLGYSDGSKI